MKKEVEIGVRFISRLLNRNNKLLVMVLCKRFNKHWYPENPVKGQAYRFPPREATTVPQGTIDMNQCMDVVDRESRTGQKFSLCILTPEKEHFIRAENEEIISGRPQVIEKFQTLDNENTEHMETSMSSGTALSNDTQQGRSEKRVYPRKRMAGDIVSLPKDK